jgi:hypothetical protein
MAAMAIGEGALALGTIRKAVDPGMGIVRR